MHAKRPVVSGHVISAECSLASCFRISFVVSNFPLRTVFMIASTSRGAGISIVFARRRLADLSSSVFTFGKPLLCWSFSAQVVFAFLLIVWLGFSGNEKGHTTFKQSSVPHVMIRGAMAHPSHEESDRDQA